MSRRPFDPEQYLESFAACLIADAIRDAIPETWERRARDFDQVPNPEVATACRNKAEVLRRYPIVPPRSEVLTALREVA